MTIKQEFEVTGDNKVANAYRKLAEENAKLRKENEQLFTQTKGQASELEKLTGRRLAMLLEEIRRTQELKRARGELIATTNFYTTGRGGGAGNVPPGGVDFRGPRDAPIPGIGYRYGQGALGTWHAEQPLHLPDPLSGILTKQLATVAKLAAGFTTLQSVMSMVSEELEQRMQMERNAMDAHRDLARGHAEIFLNTYEQGPAEQQKFLEAARSISKDTGLPEDLIGASLGRQAGRGVGFSVEQIIAAQAMAARLARHTPEQLNPLSTVIQQTMRIGNADVEKAAALAQSAAAAAFVGDPLEQSQFLAQTVSGAAPGIPNPTFKSIEEAFELAAFASQAAGSEHGRAARTSTISLVSQLAEFREGRKNWEEDVLGGPPGMKRNRKVPGMPTDPVEAIHWLQQNPRFARRFTDKMSFEAQFEPIWRNLILSPGGGLDTLLKETEGVVEPNVPALHRQLANLEHGTRQIQLANEAAKTTAAGRSTSGRLSIAELQGEARTIRDKALTDSAPYRAEEQRLIDRFGWYVARKAADWSGRDVDQGALEDLQFARSAVGRSRYRNSTDAQVLGAQFDAQIRRLEEIRDEIKELRRGGNDRVPSAGPAMNGQRALHSESYGVSQ